ncbi:c-type cytochrome [Paenirhodobacter enshiensis]|uniref:c-type cytochrome n=1 Tax=Paenirhodobacter enshiensis TaxID=1105367 RepID=UPI0035B4AD2E
MTTAPRHLAAALLLALMPGAAPADPAAPSGDVDAGERLFTRCKACHSITAPDGTAVMRGGKVGPNLYGVVGRTAGTYPGFAYSAGVKQAGEAGLVWSEALIAEYVRNPTAFIDAHGGSGPAKMAFQLPSGGADVAAYLASVAPPAGEPAAGAGPAPDAPPDTPPDGAKQLPEAGSDARQP